MTDSKGGYGKSHIAHPLSALNDICDIFDLKSQTISSVELIYSVSDGPHLLIKQYITQGQHELLAATLNQAKDSENGNDREIGIRQAGEEESGQGMEDGSHG